MSRNPNEAVILSAARTPSGRFQGSLSSLPAPRLGAIASRQPSSAPACQIQPRLTR